MNSLLSWVSVLMCLYCFPQYVDRPFFCLEEVVLKDLSALLSSFCLQSSILPTSLLNLLS